MSFTFEWALNRISGKGYKRMSQNEKERFLKAIFFDNVFYDKTFNPPENIPKEEIVEKVNALYAFLIRRNVIYDIYDVIIPNKAYKKLDRSASTILYSVANLATQTSNERYKSLDDEYKDGKMTKREYNNALEELEKDSKSIAVCNKMSRKIVKKPAKILSSKTGVPVDVCIKGYQNVPNPKYIDHNRISAYLYNFLEILYNYLKENPIKNPGEMKWKKFFSEIFGDKYLADIALYILLEGNSNVSELKKSSEDNDAILDVWAALSDMALDILEEAPDVLRNQMLELYLKKVKSMVLNNNFEIRENLFELSKKRYPNLVATASRLKDKFLEIINKAEG